MDGEIGRQAEDGERDQPGEGVGLHQEGLADPPQPHDQIAEAEPPAGGEGAPIAASAGDRRAVDQQHQDRQGQRQHRPHAERRHGERGQRAGKEGERQPPPAGREHDAVGERHRHWWHTSRQRFPKKDARGRPGGAHAASGSRSTGRGALCCSAGGGRLPRASGVAAMLGTANRMPHALAGRDDAQPLHPARIGVQHLDLEGTGAGDDLAAHRHAAGERDQQAAKRDRPPRPPRPWRRPDRPPRPPPPARRERRRCGCRRAASRSAASPRRRARPRCRRRSPRRDPPSRPMPSMPPYSSMTSARWMRLACMLASSSMDGMGGRHEQQTGGSAWRSRARRRGRWP